MNELTEFLKSTDFLMPAGVFCSGAAIGWAISCKLADYLARREKRRAKINHPYLR